VSRFRGVGELVSDFGFAFRGSYLRLEIESEISKSMGVVCVRRTEATGKKSELR
jgi:hypothetical protein